MDLRKHVFNFRLEYTPVDNRAISRFKGISNIGNNDGCPSKWGARIKTKRRKLKVQSSRFRVEPRWSRPEQWLKKP
jgi:hypothetical protein